MKIVKYIAGAWLLAAAGSATAQNGQEIFNNYCISCHTIGKGQVVGPDLKGAHKKHKEKWLRKWIKSSQTMVQENDPKAVELFNQFNQIVMPDQPLSDADLTALISYIKTESGDGAVQAAAPAASEIPTASTSEQPAPVADNTSAPTAPVAAENPAIVPAGEGNLANVVTGGPYKQAGSGGIMSGGDFFSTLWISLVAVFFLGILAVMAKVIFSLSTALNDKYERKS